MQRKPPDPWMTLGIAQTSDVRAIKRAYALKLKSIDIESEPDRFSDLRHAYQSVCAALSSPEAQWSDDGATGAHTQPPCAPDAALVDAAGESDLRSDAVPARPDAVEHASQALATLSRLTPSEQRRWLESLPELTSIAFHGSFGDAALDLLVDDYPRWSTCADALSAHMQWEVPLRVHSRRDLQLLRLAAHRAQAVDARRAIALLEELASQATLIDRLRLLQETQGTQEDGLELALLREIAARPETHAKVAWALLVWFGWKPPESADSEYRQLLHALLDPCGPRWSLVRDAALLDLVDDLRRKSGTTAQRRLLASDVRLEDPRWRPMFEAALRSHCDRNASAAESRAIALHFGWDPMPSRPPARLALPDAAHGEVPIRWPRTVVALVLALLILGYAIR